MESYLNKKFKVSRVKNASSVQHKLLSHKLRGFFTEYCSNSTVHGFQYFTEPKRHWSERCFWVLAVGLSISTCCWSIRDVWIKWHDKMTEQSLPISDVPFPTVTICPEVKTLKTKLDLSALHGLESKSWNLTENEWARTKALRHICDASWNKPVDSNEHFVNASIFGVIEEMAPTLKDAIPVCHFKHTMPIQKQCEDLFVPNLAEDGLCFSFNALNSNEVYTDEMASEMMSVRNLPSASDWNIEDGYKTTANAGSYPARVYSAKKNGALDFLLHSMNKDIEFVCRPFNKGFKLFIHTPGDIVFPHTWSKNAIEVRVPFSEKVQISITPKYITAAPGLRSYSSEQRNCYFHSDNRLRFYKLYSENNCRAECLANYTLSECGCVKFSMPRTESTKICGLSKISCYTSAKLRLFNEDIIDGMSNEEAKSFRQKCDCLQSCATITYEARVEHGKYNLLGGLAQTFNVASESLKVRISKVTIQFDEPLMDTLRREEHYTFPEFLSICGGLLGLGLGVSALSIIEFLYYLSLRLYWSLLKSNDAVVTSNRRRVYHLSIIYKPKKFDAE